MVFQTEAYKNDSWQKNHCTQNVLIVYSIIFCYSLQEWFQNVNVVREE